MQLLGEETILEINISLGLHTVSGTLYTCKNLQNLIAHTSV
jgi:hypothetical protein